MATRPFIAAVNAPMESWRLDTHKQVTTHEGDRNVDAEDFLWSLCSGFQGEDSSCNMDGFYDQQVPFMVPESVSLKV